MENQNNQTGTVEVTTEQVVPTETVTENVSEATSVVNAQPTENFAGQKSGKTFDFRKLIMILSIVGLGLFFLWFIITNALLKKGGYDEAAEVYYIYGKTGDALLKVFASLIIVVSAGILGFITYEFAMLIKAKKNKKTTACWGSALAAVMATLLIVMILLIVDIAAKETFSYEFEESYSIDRWITKQHFVHCEIAILATMFALTLVGSLTALKSANFGKLLSMTNFVLACAGLVFFILATSFMGASWYNNIARESDTQIALGLSGIYTYYILAVLAGVMMILLAGQISLFLVENFAALKGNKVLYTKLVLLVVALVVVLVFMSLLGSKLSKGDFGELVEKWITEDNVGRVKYLWRTNAVFAGFTAGGMILGGVTNLVFDKIKKA